jgi:diguanylate cyclase
MQGIERGPNIDPQVLMEIIRTQTEIAKLGADLSGVVALAADRVQSLTQAEGASVELTEGGDMIYRAAAGMAEPLLGMHLNRAGSLSGLCIELGQVLRCDDTHRDDRVDKEAARLVGMRSIVVSPLEHDGVLIGVLKIMSSSVAAFDDQDVRVLELMSELIAALMFHAARYETDELFHRATHDALTGLANRALFYDRLRHQVALARRQSSHLGILILDMDGLKRINDRHGHRAGDAALRETAARIIGISRQSDTVARLGGDEFGVVLSKVTSRESAIQASERIFDEIRMPFQFEGKDLPLCASIGVAIFPEDGSDIESIIEWADQCMYAVKRTRECR